MFGPLRRGVSRLLRLNGTPHGIALGFTLGLGLSLLPVPFAGMLLALALAPMLDANPVATYLGTAVVNPVTIAVFYFTELWIGASLLGLHAPGWEEARAFDAAQWWSVLKELLPAFALGGPLLGLAVSAVSYPLLRWLVQRYQRNQTAGEG
ncbi:MAG: DUF2062 domain-containing protein [Polyangiales bacterium]